MSSGDLYIRDLFIHRYTAPVTSVLAMGTKRINANYEETELGDLLLHIVV